MSVVSGVDIHGGRQFNENSPRPPVPGEETERVGTCSPTHQFSRTSTWGLLVQKIKGGGSPVLTPRRSSLPAGFSSASLAESNAPLGFEPEGSCAGGDAGSREGRYQGSCSPPPHLLWASNLQHLLNDSDGVDLFRQYLEQESQHHADALNFWFACKGLKTHSDPDKVTQLVKVIYRRYLLRPQIAISDELRKEVTRRIKEDRESVPRSVFDAVQYEVEHLMNETCYPSFLKSEIYLQYVHSMQSGPCVDPGSSTGSSNSSSHSRELPCGSSGVMLATVPEDSELPTSAHLNVSYTAPNDPVPRLTRNMLMATQDRRATELRPMPEAYAGVYLHRSLNNNPYYPQPAYLGCNSYNPVSRQDSELQSLSSDARTDCDSISLTDRSLDGASIPGSSHPPRRQHLRCRKPKEYAYQNQDPYINGTFIPRTDRIDESKLMPHLSPEEFVAAVCEKLEKYIREKKLEKDKIEKLERKLQESELNSEPSMCVAAGPSRSLATSLRDKLVVEDDSDQAILDQHVSRVWSDLTPSRSPGFDSPNPKSPMAKRRGLAAQPGTLPSRVHPPTAGPYQRPGHARYPRKDKDVFSTFSSDSGNVHDFPDSEHKHHVPKSKSVPDHADTVWQGRRGPSSKKAVPETDSGVSVFSDTPPVVPSAQFKEKEKENSKVLQWLKGSAKEERESKHRLRMSATSPSASRHSRNQGVELVSGSRSRSGSQERCLGVGSVGVVGGCGSGCVGGGGGGGAATEPAQPFLTNPLMPLLPQPHTSTQLEEAARRLMHSEDLNIAKQRHMLGGKAELPVSNPATVRRPNRVPQSKVMTSAGSSATSGGPTSGIPTSGIPTTGGPTPGPSEQASQIPATIVVFSFCDEQVPYRTKIPARPVTLKQFKEVLPKKGNFRYFFKTDCEEVETKVIQEEITDDNDVLPIWEGKVMAQVKLVE